MLSNNKVNVACCGTMLCENITSSLEMYVLDNGCIVLGSGYKWLYSSVNEVHTKNIVCRCNREHYYA